jgi:hypothetical protein
MMLQYQSQYPNKLLVKPDLGFLSWAIAQCRQNFLNLVAQNAQLVLE